MITAEKVEMLAAERTLGRARTRADRVRARRARQVRKVEPLRKGPKPKRRSRPRRRYDLALPAELGAEMRLPAMPSFRVGARLLTVPLLGAVAFGLYQVITLPMFRTGEAEVEGAGMFSAAQIRSIAEVDDRSVFLIDPGAAEAKLLEQPEIAAARVRVSWPNQVGIEVIEREPMIEWWDGGRTWWLSVDGVAFLQHGEREGLVRVRSDAPVLDIGEDPLAEVIAPEVLVAAGVLRAELPEAGELRYDPVHGLGFDDPRGWAAYFGVKGDMVVKVRLYRAIAAGLEEKGIVPGLVSVENPSAPYYSEKR